MSSQQSSIIIVDDESMILEIFREEFEERNFKVFSAGCGEEAMELIKQNRVNTIISDIQMPNGDGKWLLDQVKKHWSKNAPPFVFVSGFSKLSNTEAIKAGASAYFSKPVNLEKLVPYIHTLCEIDKKTGAKRKLPSVPQPQALKNKVIFYAEDSEGDQELIQKALKNQHLGDMHLETFVDGATLLNKLFPKNASDAVKPDLILLDMDLPKVSGMDLLVKIKADPKLKEIPVIMVTASISGVVRHKALELGADAFFTKQSSVTGWEHLVTSFAQSWIR